MLTLKVYGNYSPNTIGLPGSCYLLEGMSRKIIFDLGNGNFKRLKKDLTCDELKNSLLILSHNHVDHSWDVLKLALYLITKKDKIDIYLPRKSIMFWAISHLRKVFNINIITEATRINIDNFEISFCKTIHKGESYATKLVGNGLKFVYTSDMASVSDNVQSFCKNADIVLIDAGHPCKDELFSLNGYHGKTAEILNQLLDIKCNAKKVLASHLKAGLEREKYISVFPKNKDITLVKRGKKYLLA